MKIRNKNMKKNPKKSFQIKYGVNGIISKFLGVPNGLFDIDSWMNIKWIIIKIIIMKGKIKWIEKNRVRVGFLTEKFPQIHNVKFCPMYGMALKIFVITVAPQKDICPQGRT